MGSRPLWLLLSNLLTPHLEQDLTKAISQQLATIHNMVDCMIAPAVHSFLAEPFVASSFVSSASHTTTSSFQGNASVGRFGRPTSVQAQREQQHHQQQVHQIRKIEYPVPGRGLFD